MAEPVVLVVNGKPHIVQAEAETPLLYVLRNEPGLTGPQFGCGQENCGACMVLIGDKATPSCKLPVSLSRALKEEVRFTESRITRFYGKPSVFDAPSLPQMGETNTP